MKTDRAAKRVHWRCGYLAHHFCCSSCSFRSMNACYWSSKLSRFLSLQQGFTSFRVYGVVAHMLLEDQGIASCTLVCSVSHDLDTVHSHAAPSILYCLATTTFSTLLGAALLALVPSAAISQPAPVPTNDPTSIDDSSLRQRLFLGSQSCHSQLFLYPALCYLPRSSCCWLFPCC